ncbi:MAG: hypothetical protein OEU32_07290 [Acidimicrobiia bacterium]|nr:hypothetical protein [Acidimicrobiia bacterium]
MVAAVVALSAAVALLAVLVAALLRSHAEILRQLHDITHGRSTADAEFEVRTRAGVPTPGEGAPSASDIVGVDVAGDAIAVGVLRREHLTLLAFLSSGCLTCRTFWDAFASPADLGLRRDVRLVVVTKDPDQESPAEIASLAPPSAPTVMSSSAWDDFGVPVAPYFVLVDGPSGAVIGEGASAGWAQVRDLMNRALADTDVLDGMRTRGGRSGSRDRDADIELLDAGITPGDPMLHHDEPIEDVEVE